MTEDDTPIDISTINVILPTAATTTTVDMATRPNKGHSSASMSSAILPTTVKWKQATGSTSVNLQHYFDNHLVLAKATASASSIVLVATAASLSEKVKVKETKATTISKERTSGPRS
ncbi:hypothetical protein EDD11_000112 [Mortierella claussenii]|nr:hypothetical protein EDD11_000112 [Mortierella claussenii]